jgi:hypothetical protein
VSSSNASSNRSAAQYSDQPPQPATGSQTLKPTISDWSAEHGPGKPPVVDEIERRERSVRASMPASNDLSREQR